MGNIDDINNLDKLNNIDEIDKNLLKQVSNLEKIPVGAYNIRKNGQGIKRNTTANIDIVTKTDKQGIDIIVLENTKNESIHIPVIISESGLTDVVYNDFHIGANADVTIIAGCGIHNNSSSDSQHDGIHSFYLEENAKVKYVEKHYGDGNGSGEKILNPKTIIHLKKGSTLEMETVQIKGVDSTTRETDAFIGDDANLLISEKIMTHNKQIAKTIFNVELNGENSSTHVSSRSIAEGNSYQEFVSNIDGNNKSFGHVECDAIIMNNAKVVAIPKISANHVESNLVHEAAIGKIAGEQLTKLMTLGLTEKEAEEQIISGFLK